MALIERVIAALEAFRATPGTTATPAAEEKPPRMPRGATTSLTENAPITHRTPIILGPSMTPGAVASALSSAAYGRMHRLCDLLSEQREKVTHLQATMATREQAIKGTKWVIRPRPFPQDARKRDLSQAEYWRNFCDAKVQKIGGFADHLGDLNGAGVYMGRGGKEKVYARDTDGIYVRELVDVHSKRLSFADLTNWRLHLYDEFGNDREPALSEYPGIDIAEEYPAKFILHQPKTIGGEIATRQGLGRSLAYTALFWGATTRWWMQFVELFVMPWRVGTYQKGADPADIQQLKLALLNMSGLSTAVFPEGCKPEFIQPHDTSGKTHSGLHVAFNHEISKVILGQTLTTEVGDKGTQALGTIHDQVRQDIKTSDGRSLSETIDRDLLWWLVALNAGPDVADKYCPSFVLLTEPEEDIDAEFERFSGLAQLGVDFDADEARKRYTRMSKPTPESVLVKPIAAPANDGGPPNDGGDAPTDAKKTDKKPSAKGDKPKPGSKAA